MYVHLNKFNNFALKIMNIHFSTKFAYTMQQCKCYFNYTKTRESTKQNQIQKNQKTNKMQCQFLLLKYCCCCCYKI